MSHGTKIEDGNVSVIGAGILPFSIDPIFGKAYFLLGKEKTYYQWPKGSNKWSDFGGGVKVSDSCPEETAAREFLEESLGCVFLENEDELDTILTKEIFEKRKEFIKQRLLDNQYILKLEKIWSGFDYQKKVYIIFVIQIPWDPECMYRFDDCSFFLNASIGIRDNESNPFYNHIAVEVNEEDNNEVISIHKDFLEKKKIMFWSAIHLREAENEYNDNSFRGGKHERIRDHFQKPLSVILNTLQNSNAHLFS